MAATDDSGDARWRVFVSHTSELRDFPAGGSYVAAVERAISACGHVIVDMADFPAADLPATELCRERVRSCDVYVGVLGTRFGSVVPDMPQVSYTELEFDTATEAALPRLVFMLDTGAPLAGIPLPWPAGLEPDGRQEEFRRRVQAELVTRSFTDPATLGQLVERSLRELAVQETQAMTRPIAGRLLAEVTDPFALEVHRPVQPDTPQPDLPVLPVYVPREHDTDLERIVMAALQGSSGIAVLVGGSSTGKTRACWEALQLLRDRKPGWRLWHPIDPSPPEAALRDLPSIGPRTVVWLNEAQFYLDVASGGLGEQIAAGLRELLRDPARAPVLVLATLWPQFWDRLTARTPADVADPHAQAREFLSGRDISVPAAFTATQLQQLVGAADPRLARAAEAAEGGQVIQFLAGAPELLARYRNAPPPAAALISAAIDARRLGMGIALPLAFLEAAAPGYLTDTEWDSLGEDWLEQALAYTAAPAKGIRGPLASIRPRINASTILAHGLAYRLADYLEQYGRRTRCEQLSPLSLWDALAAHTTSPTDLLELSQAAENRGLYRQAATLFTKGAALGSVYAAAGLIRLLHGTCPEDARSAAHWVAAHISPDDPVGVAGLLDELRDVGAEDAAQAVAARAATAWAVEARADTHASLASLNEPRRVAWVLYDLREAGVDDAARALAARAATHTSLDDPEGVAILLKEFREAGADDAARALAARAARAAASLSDRGRVAILVRELREAGAHDAARDLSERAAAHASLSDSAGADPPLEELLALRAEDLALRAEDKALPERAAQASLDDPADVARLLRKLREARAHDAARDLGERAAAQVALDHPGGVAILLRELRHMGADGTDLAVGSFYDPFGVGVLRWELQQEAGGLDLSVPSFYDPLGVGPSLEELRQAGADGTIQTLLGRGPAEQAALDHPGSVARLLEEFRLAGADTSTRALLARDPAAQAGLDDPSSVAELVRELRAAGADDAARILARRAATHTSLEYRRGVQRLLTQMQAAGAEDAVQILARRAANVGWFRLARGFFPDEAVRYRFGRQPDETPAQPWRWQQP